MSVGSGTVVTGANGANGVAWVVLGALLVTGCGPVTPQQADHLGRPRATSTSPAPVTTAPATTAPAPDPHPDRLRAGERPPQFVLVSFDGAGWHDMWDHWLGVADQVPFHFTGFLSGTYLLSGETRDRYHPPGYAAGTSAIGWTEPQDVPVEIADLDRALASGNEIGTHFNGHFCVGAGLPTGGNTWTTRDWDAELDQFFALLADVRRNNGLGPDDTLDVTGADIHGARTPCLEGLPDELYPALAAHGLDYDSSFSHSGLAWPTRSPGGIWEVGMAVYPVHGLLPDGRTGVGVTSMDYNYYFTQRGASDDGLTVADSAQDRAQVLATYEDMYDEAYAGNRAPLVLGNHFNDWNHGAYRDALTDFVLETCGQPETRCVTYSELVDWMEQQTPATLRRLQAG